MHENINVLKYFGASALADPGHPLNTPHSAKHRLESTVCYSRRKWGFNYGGLSAE